MIRLYVTADLAEGVAVALGQGQSHYLASVMRRAVGDDYRVMLDSTWGYDFPTALRVGGAIEEMGFYWYEDPLHDQDVYNYVKLRQTLRGEGVKRRGVVGQHCKRAAFGVRQHTAGIAHKGINTSNAGGQNSGGHNAYSTDNYGRDMGLW